MELVEAADLEEAGARAAEAVPGDNNTTPRIVRRRRLCPHNHITARMVNRRHLCPHNRLGSPDEVSR